MRDNLKLPYFGGKLDDNINITYELLPQGKIEKIADMCLGSGNVTRNISCEMEGIDRLGIEKDETMFAVHYCIANYPELLIKELRKLENNEETFKKMKKIIDNCLNGDDVNQLEVAVATLYTICFSYNSMRDRRRIAKYGHLDFDNELRKKEEACLKAFESIFYTKLPMIIMDLHEAWQRVQLINDDFLNHLYMLEEEGTFCYIDPPYELHKRGIPKGEKRKHAGYLFDLGQKEHESLIKHIEKISRENKLRAYVALCTNYEIEDDTQKLIIPDDDLYANVLLPCGFRLVVVEVKGSSEVIRKHTVDEKEPKKRRKRKAEVLFINYNIVGNLDNFEYIDEI